MRKEINWAREYLDWRPLSNTDKGIEARYQIAFLENLNIENSRTMWRHGRQVGVSEVIIVSSIYLLFIREVNYRWKRTSQILNSNNFYIQDSWISEKIIKHTWIKEFSLNNIATNILILSADRNNADGLFERTLFEIHNSGLSDKIIANKNELTITGPKGIIDFSYPLKKSIHTLSSHFVFIDGASNISAEDLDYFIEKPGFLAICGTPKIKNCYFTHLFDNYSGFKKYQVTTLENPNFSSQNRKDLYNELGSELFSKDILAR